MNNQSGSSHSPAAPDEKFDTSASISKTRSPMDQLTKEELLTKCKNLITIAQKAKSAKDEVVEELKKSQETAKSENDALLEMVNNLTEGKVALITKTESLQRQLNLANSELERVETCQSQLLQSKEEALEKAAGYENKIQRMKDRFEKYMQSEEDKQEQLLEKQRELSSKIENLEAQNSQIEVLKSKYKKLLSEKEKFESLAKDSKTLIAEKKANEIVLAETKSQKKQLEEKIISLYVSSEQFKKKSEELESSLIVKDEEISRLKAELHDRATEVLAISDTSGIVQLQAQIDEYRCKCSELQQLVTDLEKRGVKKSVTEEITETITVRPCNHVEDLAEFEMLRQKQDEFNTVAFEMETLKAKNAELEKECHNTSVILNEYKDIKEKFSMQSSDIEVLKDELEKTSSERNDLEHLLCEANEKYQTLKNEFDQIQNAVEQAKSEQKLYFDERASVQKETETLLAKLESKRAINHQLNLKIDEITKQAETTQASFENLSVELNSVKKDYAQCKLDISSLESKCSELEISKAEQRLQLECSQQQLEALKMVTQNQCDEMKLQVNEDLRTLQNKCDHSNQLLAEKSKLVEQLENSVIEFESRIRAMNFTIEQKDCQFTTLQDGMLSLVTDKNNVFLYLRKVFSDSVCEELQKITEEEGVIAVISKMLAYVERHCLELSNCVEHKDKALKEFQMEASVAMDQRAELQGIVDRLNCDLVAQKEEAVKEIAGLKATLEEMQLQNESFIREISELKITLADCDTVRDKFNLIVNERDLLNDKYQKSVLECESLTKELEQSNMNTEQQLQETNNLREKLLSSDKLAAELSETLENERKTFEEKIQQEKRIIDEKDISLGELKQSISNIQHQLEAADTGFIQMKTDLEAQLGEKENKYEEIKSANSKLFDENDKLIGEISELKALQSQFDEKILLLENSKINIEQTKNQIIEEIEKTLVNLQKEIERLELTCSSQVQDIETLRAQLDVCTESNASSSAQRQALHQEYAQLNQNYEDSLKKLKELEDYIEVLREEKLNALQELEGLCNVKTKMELLQTESAAIRDEALKYRQLCDEYENKIDTLMKKQTEIQLEQREKHSLKTPKIDEVKNIVGNKCPTLQEQLTEPEEDCHHLKRENESLKVGDESLASNLESNSTQLTKEIDELKQKLSEIMSEREELIEKVNCLQENEAAKETIIRQVSNSNDGLQRELKVALHELEMGAEDKKSLEKEIKNLNSCLASAVEDKNSFEAELSKISSELSCVQLQVVSLNKECEEHSVTSSSCLKELEQRTEECKQLLLEKQELASSCALLQSEVQQLHDLTEQVVAARQEAQQCRTRAEDLEATVGGAREREQQLQEQVDSSAARCQELLQELNDVTGVLRERGERISRLESAVKEKSSELELTQTELKSRMEQLVSNERKESAALQDKLRITELEAALNTAVLEKEDALQALDKMRSNNISMAAASVGPDTSVEVSSGADASSLVLNVADALSSVPSVVPSGADATSAAGDGHSTSTISKAEEAHRLKDLEDTFEERYMKLKSVAIKLKKKLAEQTVQLKSAEDQKNKLLAEKEQLGSVKNASINIQVLQGEIDRLQDALESSCRSLKERDAKLATTSSLLADTKHKLELQTEQQAVLQASVKSLEEFTALQKTKEIELQAKVESLTKHASGIEEEEQKQSSLLSLELQDSERTIAELRAQLDEQDAAAQRSAEHSDAQLLRISALTAQLQQLTAQRAAEEAAAEHVRKNLEEQQTLLIELEKEATELRAAKKSLVSESELLRQELEGQKVALSEASLSNTQAKEQAKLAAARFTKQAATLEQRLESVTCELQQAREELQFVKLEYDGYKSRAQSVLRQQQQQHGSATDAAELQHRLHLAESQLQLIQQSNRHLQSDLSALQSEHKFLQAEKERLSRQAKQDAEAASKQLVTLKEERDQLNNQLLKAAADNQAVISKSAAEGEAMAKCYSEQLETQSKAHEREVCNLQCQLDAMRLSMGEVKGSNTVHEERSAAASTHVAPKLHRRTDSGDDLRALDMSSMIREQGEGSEWVDPEVHHRNAGRFPSLSVDQSDAYNPPPLNQLILSGSSFSADDSVSITGSAADQPVSTHYGHLLSTLQSKLDAYEVRMQQVSALLTESEAENAKLVQLTEALKEEIRRGSRNTRREKHLENLEYLKNVVLQFISMTDVDGRERLLPVLSTLLQLSPAELKRIETLVKGDGSTASQGWGSYLHMWSGR